jgi:hemerythrin-like domain-containing protein
VIALRDGAQQERIKLDAARDILDRGGHKAIERVQAVIEHQASPELVSNLSSLLQELRKVRVVQIEEVSALPDRISAHIDAEDAEFTTNEENT